MEEAFGLSATPVGDGKSPVLDISALRKILEINRKEKAPKHPKKLVVEESFNNQKHPEISGCPNEEEKEEEVKISDQKLPKKRAKK